MRARTGVGRMGWSPNCVTGQDIVLDWVLGSLDVAAHLEVSQCVALPRLGSYIAALLTEPKHLRGDLGVQFQAYIRVSPKGRAMLQMVARNFSWISAELPM